jgi:hypothetical protein
MDTGVEPRHSHGKGLEVRKPVVMKNSIFWDITPCSPLKVNFHLLSRLFLARIILWPWGWERHVPPKRRLTFNGLHGVISEKTAPFTLHERLLISIPAREGASCTSEDDTKIASYATEMQSILFGRRRHVSYTAKESGRQNRLCGKAPHFCDTVVMNLLKARTVEPDKPSLLGNGCVTHTTME